MNRKPLANITNILPAKKAAKKGLSPPPPRLSPPRLSPPRLSPPRLSPPKKSPKKLPKKLPKKSAKKSPKKPSQLYYSLRGV